MFCKNCGKEMKNGSAFCPECGAKLELNETVQANPIEANTPQPDIANIGDTASVRKMSKGKIILIAVFAILIIIVIACAVGGSNENNKGTSNITQNQEQVEQKIYDILNNTPVTDGYNTTIGVAVNTAFVDYSVNYEEWGNDKTFNVDISGTYLPNPEISQYTQNGEITYLIDIEKGSCTVKSDPDDIQSTLLVYVVNYLG